MIETHEAHIVDRAGWARGPWDDEPDRLEWHHRGMPCLMLRNWCGVWCGYVAVNPDHPYYGQAYSEMDGDIEVHGGLTYSDPITSSGLASIVAMLGTRC